VCRLGPLIPRGAAADAATGAQIPPPGQFLAPGDADPLPMAQVHGAAGHGCRHRWRAAHEPQPCRGVGDRLAVKGTVNAQATAKEARPRCPPLAIHSQGKIQGPQEHATGPAGTIRHHVAAVMHTVAGVDVKMPRLAKKGCVAGTAAAVSMAGRLALAIGFRFHNHPPAQLPPVTTHQQTAQ